MNSPMTAKTETIHPDTLLIERIKSGDTAAYNEMVTQYYDRILSAYRNSLKINRMLKK